MPEQAQLAIIPVAVGLSTFAVGLATVHGIYHGGMAQSLYVLAGFIGGVSWYHAINEWTRS